jgi:hypothetical protein
MYRSNPDQFHPFVDRECYPEVSPMQLEPHYLPQAVNDSDLEYVATYLPPKDETVYSETPTTTSVRRSRLCIAALAVILVLGIGLGVGLGIGLKRHASADTVPPSSSASPSATSLPSLTDCSGIKYCGWELTQQLGKYILLTIGSVVHVFISLTNCLFHSAGVSIDDLTKIGGQDPPNDLFLCTPDNKLVFAENCAGAYHCQPPVYGRNGCNETLGQSCCD